MALRRGTWRAAQYGHGRRTRRYVRFALSAVVVLLLLSLIGFFIFRPFWHPNTHLLFIAAGDADAVGAPKVGFVDEAFAELQQLEPALYQRGRQDEPIRIDCFASPGQMNTLAADLALASTGRTDILVVYAAAHGISYDGRPYLICDNFDPSDFQAGIYSVGELVRQLKRSSAKTKLLIVDAGRLDYDPRLGILHNEFVDLLQDSLHRHAPGDPSLWFLTSHSPGETSHLDYGHRNSVFGRFVVEGLRGGADLDNDREIDVGELFRYVSANVSAWVNQYSGGNSTQTPQLISNRPRDSARSFPVVISLSTLLRKAAEEESKTAEASAAANGGPANGSAGGAPAAQPSSSQAERLREVERLSDDLVRRTVHGVSPIDTDAHLWRVVLARLQRIRFLHRQGRVAEGEAEAARLEHELQIAKNLGVPPTDPEAAPGDLGRRIGARLRDSLVTVSRPTSLALAELGTASHKAANSADGRAPAGDGAAASRDDAAPAATGAAAAGSAGASPSLRSVATEFDQLLQVGPRDEFQTWVEKLDKEHRDLFELQLAARLAPRDDIEWRHVQLALQTRRSGEIRAAVPGYLSWVRNKVEEADRIRTAAERMLVDGHGGSAERAAAQLKRAGRLYEQAAADLETVREARHTANDVLFRAPQLVRWHNVVRQARGIVVPRHDDLQALLEATEILNDLLERDSKPTSRGALAPGSPGKPDANAFRLMVLKRPLADTHTPQLSSVRNWSLKCRQLLGAVEANLQREDAALLAGAIEERGAAWKIHLLLNSPLLDTESRVLLRRVAASADDLLAARFLPPNVAAADWKAPRATPVDWESLRLQCELEYSLARLAAQDLPTAKRSFDAVEAAIQGVRAAGSADREVVVRSFASLGDALRSFYRELPDNIEDAVRTHRDLSDEAARPERLRVLQAAQRAQRLVDARDAEKIETNLEQLLSQAARYDLLAWHSRRFTRAQLFAPPNEIAGLARLADRCRREALEIPAQPPLPAPRGTVTHIELPEELALSEQLEIELPIVVNNRGAAQMRAWVVLRYDRQLIDVEFPGRQDVYLGTLSDEPSEGKRADQPPPPPTFLLSPGETETFRVRVRRLGYTARPSSLAVNLITAEGLDSVPEIFFYDEKEKPWADLTRGTPSDSRSYVRRDVPIRLPHPESSQVEVVATPGTWARAADGLLLHPFPNKITPYQLRLVNRTPVERTVGVRLLATDQPPAERLPSGSLSSTNVAKLLSRLGPVRPLYNVPQMKLPADDRGVTIPFGSPGDELAASSDKSDKSDESDKSDGNPGASSPAINVNGGLLLVVTDAASETSSVKQISFSPQRPRRYISAEAGYDLETQRVWFDVRAVDPSLIPPEGTIVELEFVDPPVVGTQARLTAKLAAPVFETRLYARVPSSPNRVVHARLIVDGYPRAFEFRVPISADARGVVEEKTLRAISFVEPAAGLKLPAPMDAIPVKLQIDAPVGSFQSGDDYFEVGVDTDLDREFRGEQTQRFHSDRQVAVSLAGVSPDGTLRVQTRVTDYQLELPLAGLQNVHVNLLARMQAVGKESWSEPVKLLLDAAPPQIDELILTPRTQIVVGQELAVAMGVTDQGGSGVEKVQIAFDLAGTGEFVAERAPIAAESQSPVTWFAKLPTGELKPGNYTILARATDAAGNSSDYLAVPNVNVITPEMAVQRQETNRVLGTVRFGTDPAAGMKMTLRSLAPDGPEIQAVFSDASGGFTFAEVPPGKYELLAEGKIKNGGRSIVPPRGEERFGITVGPPSAGVVRLNDVKVR